MGEIPALSGAQLFLLLKCDGWKPHSCSDAHVSVKKRIEGRYVVAPIPMSNASLPQGTLSGILGSKETRIGRRGLVRLLNKYGLPKNRRLRKNDFKST